MPKIRNTGDFRNGTGQILVATNVVRCVVQRLSRQVTVQLVQKHEARDQSLEAMCIAGGGRF